MLGPTSSSRHAFLINNRQRPIAEEVAPDKRRSGDLTPAWIFRQATWRLSLPLWAMVPA
jgi:hypothetical protein